MISKQQYESQLLQILRLLLEYKTQEEIARELNISTRTVARYVPISWKIKWSYKYISC